MRLLPCVFGFVLFLGAALSPTCAAAEESLHEQWLKAYFLYKLPQFIEWPAARECTRAETNTPTRLCVYGEDPFRHVLRRMAETFDPHGRSVLVFHDYELDTLRCCDVVFVTRSERERAAPLVDSLRSLPLVTVSDAAGFSGIGGTLEITRAGPQIQFIVNRRPARESGIRMSPKLLRMARTVFE